MTLLKDMPTHALGDDMSMALYSERKGKFNYFCLSCNRRHSGIFYCEFCLANELYTRRKTMAFMRLDLCVQAAVCLIAKNAQKSTVSPSRESEPKFTEIRKGHFSTPVKTDTDFYHLAQLKPYLGDDNGQD